ncbi:hypothetical protein [Priestia aryabhattai]|uniref:hypothetical protein n=1 Tax=Priestia aryabhattai TaxID=412384 RepID=UPI000BFCB074|nr:hypothetical protein [Priestia aryabhattai]PHF78021.1 hypothetical protein COI42_02500 [Priestia aryabhattai]
MSKSENKLFDDNSEFSKEFIKQLNDVLGGIKEDIINVKKEKNNTHIQSTSTKQTKDLANSTDESNHNKEIIKKQDISVNNIVSIEEFGAQGDWNGVVGTDDTDAFEKAIKFAESLNNGKGGTIHLNNKSYLITRSISIVGVSLRGSHSTEIVYRNIPEGEAAIRMNRKEGHAQSFIENIIFSGDGSWELGVQNCSFNGIEIIGKARPSFSNVFIRYFNRGMIWKNDVGHIRLHNCRISENFIGVYCEKNSGDYTVYTCDINQNNFANFATHADSGIEGLSMRDSHCGFAPFGFYCFPTPSSSHKNMFLWDVKLDRVRFEQIGNAAIYSDYSQLATPVVSSLIIMQPGFSWDIDKANRFTMNNFSRDYAIDIARLEGAYLEIKDDTYPFTKGKKNVIRIRYQSASSRVVWTGRKSNDSLVTVDSGHKNVIGSLSKERLTREDRPNEYFEKEILTEGAGTLYRFSRIDFNSTKEILTINSNDEIHIKQNMFLSNKAFHPAILTNAPYGRVGSLYSENINGVACLRVFLDGDWRRICYSNSCPNNGNWTKGDRVFSSNDFTVKEGKEGKYIIEGWVRITTGNKNILNDDWIEKRIYIGI